MKKQSFVKVLSFILALALMTSLAACGAGSTANPSSTSAVTTAQSESTAAAPVEKEKVTLRMATVFTPEHPYGPFFGQLLDNFLTDNPEVTIEREFSPGEEMAKKLKVDLASDNLPDVFTVYPGGSDADKAKANKLLDLTEAFNADPTWKDGFIGGAVDSYKYDMPGLYAAPMLAFCTGIFYNKELFQKAGAEIPKTWNELLTVIGKLKASGVIPWGIGAKDSWRPGHLQSMILIKQIGTEKIKDYGTRKASYNSPEIIDSFKSLVELVDAGAFGKSYAGIDYAGEGADFNAGKTAMRFCGSWTVGEVSGKTAPAGFADKVGFFPFPYFEGKEANKDDWFSSVSDALAISSKVDGAKKEAALKLVKYLTSTASGKFLAESTMIYLQ